MMRPAALAISLSALLASLLLAAASPSRAQSGALPQALFDDPLFRRCISWMLDGYRGAMLQTPCLDEFELPPPSLFLCARKIHSGFPSATDREGCALIFEEAAKRAREGYLK